MDIDDQIQSSDIENKLIITNLKVYLEQPVYCVNKDDFVKIIDLRAAFTSLKCD